MQVKFYNTSSTYIALNISVWHIVDIHRRLLLLYTKKASENIVTVAFHWVCQRSFKGGNTENEQRGIIMSTLRLKGELWGQAWL